MQFVSAYRTVDDDPEVFPDSDAEESSPQPSAHVSLYF